MTAPARIHPRDLIITAGPGIPTGLVIPASELQERFSRSSGPGGQSVNTTDSRAELIFDIAGSGVLNEAQKARVISALGARVVDGAVVVAASEERSQLRNRNAARARLAELLRDALAPPPPVRRPRRPSLAARQRRLDAKQHRATIKTNRRRPAGE
jgi:ribosome-associated protein